MIRNYLKIAFRNLLNNKIFSLINISGLSIGLTCCMLILLYTKDETSYDRFHRQKDNIYQLACDRIESNGTITKSAVASYVQGPAFKESIPELQSFTRVYRKDAIIKKDNISFSDEICWTDDNFFSVFSFPLVKGQPTQVLSAFNSMVLTTEAAKKYFGQTDVMGKTLSLEINGAFELFTVTGIAKPAPENSSIKFNILLPFKYLEKASPDNGWMWFSFPTFFTVVRDANPVAIAKKMEQVYQLQAKSEIDMNHEAGYDTKFNWKLFKFTEMHLNTDYQGTPNAGDPVYTYILTGISVFILLIACINFVNLSIAQSLKRNKEIGIRKVIGASRAQVMGQFLGESMVVSLISFLLAIGITLLLLPVFNQLANKQLSLTYLFDGRLVAGAFLLYTATFLAAGFYPAILLSKLNPVDSIYNKTKYGNKNSLSRTLVVLQFSLATLLIIGTLFINAQFKYLTNTSLGYNEKNLVEFVVNNAVLDKSLMDVCRNTFAGVQGVEKVSYRNIGKFGGKTIAGEKEFAATYEHIDENYLPVLQIGMLAGRNFSKDYPSDAENSVIVNETFVKSAGWTDAVGKTVDFMNLPGWGARKITVIGVVKDYHFESLKEKIKPQLFTMDPQLPLGMLVLRIKGNNIPATIQNLEKAYHNLLPEHPFQYSFRENLLQRNYENELRWKRIISFSAIVTIFISCFGLFGLAMLTTERRFKEIGIRKVLGASTYELARSISLDFMKLVMIAFLFAIPLGWYFVHKWLQNFAYRIDVSWQIFAAAGAIAVVIALATVSFHSIRAALANPVRSLKNNQ